MSDVARLIWETMDALLVSEKMANQPLDPEAFDEIELQAEDIEAWSDRFDEVVSNEPPSDNERSAPRIRLDRLIAEDDEELDTNPVLRVSTWR